MSTASKPLMHFLSVSITPLSVPQMVYHGSRSSSSRLIVANPSVGLTDRETLARTSYLQKRTSTTFGGIEANYALVKRINCATFSATDDYK